LGVCELSERVAFFEDGRVETSDRFSILNYDAGWARQELQRDPHAKDSKELKAERHHSLKPKGVGIVKEPFEPIPDTGHYPAYSGSEPRTLSSHHLRRLRGRSVRFLRLLLSFRFHFPPT
jgi:hypothetical protein